MYYVCMGGIYPSMYLCMYVLCMYGRYIPKCTFQAMYSSVVCVHERDLQVGRRVNVDKVLFDVMFRIS